MSDIILVHPFKDIIPDLEEFSKSDNEFGIINTINTFCNRVSFLSKKYIDKIKEEDFKGLSFELLGEYLCKKNSGDNRIGISNYKPVNSSEDVGVDGYGIGGNGFPATVQFKFRKGDYILRNNEDNLSNFLVSSQNDFGVRLEDDKNMLIITTALKLDEISREAMLKNKVRVLNRENLREMLDNFPEWWRGFYESIKNSRIKGEVIVPLTLREHQIEAVNSILNKKIGKIILPTGTGKTRVEAEISRQTIINFQSKGIGPYIKINTSRILLCFQLFEDIFNYLNSHGITAKYVNFNSGKADENSYISELRKVGGIYRNILSTTNPMELDILYKECIKNKLPLIVISTYHSSKRCFDGGLVPNLTINDEAHNLVSNVFSEVSTLPSDRTFFLTATEKINEDTNEGLEMNNPKIFGEILYFQSPKNMIDKGEMVPPLVHIVRSKDGQKVDLNKLDKDYEALVDSIYSAFFAHEKKLRETSYNIDELGGKVLVVCRGQEDLIEMFNTKVFENFRKKHPEINLFALSSDFGTYINGEKEIPPVSNIKKHILLKKMKSLKASDKMIVFHVDMIGEGIDVPGLTGVMPFRNCELAKFVQNIGRASRLHPMDRKRIYNNEISINDRSKWIKPYSWVIVPDFLENSEGFSDRFRNIIDELRTNYGYIPQQHTFIDNVRGLDEDEKIDVVNEKVKNRRHLDSGLEDFDHDFENMSVLEKIIFEEKIGDLKKQMENEIDKILES